MCVSATSEPTPTSETDMCLLLKYKTTRKVSMQIQKNVQLEVGGRTNRWLWASILLENTIMRMSVK